MPISLKSSRHQATLLTFIGALVLAAHSQLNAQSTADQALAKARAGLVDEALQLYEQALASEPNNVAVVRDYAAVLGSAGKYSEAIPLARRARALSVDQPVWALREFAAIYLFGDATGDALDVLEQLIRNGDRSEQTLNRHALALRWLNRDKDAERAYRDLLQAYPDSVEGLAGLAYTLADETKFSEALILLNLQDPQILKARIRVLNWAGRHYEAQQLLSKLPAGLESDREILEDRAAASRWGGDPLGAMKSVQRLSALYPGVETDRLLNDVAVEFGHAVVPSFRFSKDSFGLVERAAAADGLFHVNPAHAIRAGYQYRWFDQEGDVTRRMVRYELGWNGALTRRVSAYATAATVDYRIAGLETKVLGDGSIAVALNDTVRLNGGGGVLAMDAYPSLATQVTARFEFAEIFVRANWRTQFQARVSRYAFSDDVIRKRGDLQFTRTMLSGFGLKLNAGWRFNGLWHDRQTPDFWSPSRFHSNLAILQAEGHVTSWLEYFGELAGGFQSEAGSELQHPVQSFVRVSLKPVRYWRSSLELGKSTSSVNRSLPGQIPYSRWGFAVSSEFRFH